MHKSNLKLVMEQFLLLSQWVNCRYYTCQVKWRQELWTDKDFEFGSVTVCYLVYVGTLRKTENFSQGSK